MKKVKIPNNPTFEMADTSNVDELEVYVEQVVKALGCKGALVSDESYVSDFLTIFCDEPERSKIRITELRKASRRLKIDISEDELIIDVAKRLKG